MEWYFWIIWSYTKIRIVDSYLFITYTKIRIVDSYLFISFQTDTCNEGCNKAVLFTRYLTEGLIQY